MGEGRIVVGRRDSNLDQGYVSVEVDELIYFNVVVKDIDY